LFWYVEALTRAGRIAEGRYVFEKMLTYANHVGLFAEEIGLAGGALGNFPQAFTHLAPAVQPHGADQVPTTRRFSWLIVACAGR
jgi:GH15 family glucan-1,4-alpha-glucosidase